MFKSKIVLLLLATMMTIAAVSKVNFTDVANELNMGAFSKEKLLVNVGLNLVWPAVSEFKQDTEALKEKINLYCTGLITDARDVLDLEDETKKQWKKTMLTYHQLDAAAFGPLVDNGRFIIDNIYSWPLINTCGVDKAVSDLSKTGIPNLKVLFTSKGLAALEYMFFDSSVTSTCNLRNAKNKDIVEWLKKPIKDRQIDRCHYAKVVIQDLNDKADTLLKEWDPEGKNYSAKLIDNTIYENLDKAINKISDTLFSIEYMKDFRLGKPMGLHKECLSADKICPEDIEHKWSQISFEAMETQALTFKRIFFGHEGLQEPNFAFDDYLISLGRKDIADLISTNIDLILLELAELKTQGSFTELVQDLKNNPCKGKEEEGKANLCSLHHKVRTITTELKTDVLIALSLQAPPTFQGDND